MNSIDDLADLPGSFRETAAYLREHAAAEEAACAWEKAAEKLEDVLRRERTETLTLGEAETESGYTKSHLRRLISQDVIPNSGTEKNPRIVRSHLPKKPGHGVRWKPNRKLYSRTQVATRVIQGA